MHEVKNEEANTCTYAPLVGCASRDTEHLLFSDINGAPTSHMLRKTNSFKASSCDLL